MFKALKQLIKRRNAAVRLRLFDAGYNFAAGSLLRGVTEEELQGYGIFDRNEFDRGMDMAIVDFSRLTGNKNGN